VSARVATLTALPVLAENALARPPAGTSWIALAVEPDGAEGGTRWVGEGGVVRLTLALPLGEGVEAAEELSTILSDGLSARRLSDDTAALVCGAVRTEPARAEGAFWKVPLAIPYHLIRAR
jgi:hypothetical protein